MNPQPALAYHYPLSCLVAAALPAKPLRCWRNAALAVLFSHPLCRLEYYHEGWQVLFRETSIEVWEHGWATREDGQVVDPSIVLFRPLPDEVAYFSGRSLSREQLVHCLAGKILPLVCHSSYGDDGMGHQGYKAAYGLAMQRAQELAAEKGLPLDAVHRIQRDPRTNLTMIDLKE